MCTRVHMCVRVHVCVCACECCVHVCARVHCLCIVCVHVACMCTHVCTCACVCSCVHVCEHVCTCVRMCMCIYVHVHACVCTCMRVPVVSMCVCICMCAFVCMHTCACVCMCLLCASVCVCVYLLSPSVWLHWVLAVALRIFSRSMWGLVPWLGCEAGPLALGVQSLIHWTDLRCSHAPLRVRCMELPLHTFPLRHCCLWPPEWPCSGHKTSDPSGGRQGGVGLRQEPWPPPKGHGTLEPVDRLCVSQLTSALPSHASTWGSCFSSRPAPQGSNSQMPWSYCTNVPFDLLDPRKLRAAVASVCVASHPRTWVDGQQRQQLTSALRTAPRGSHSSHKSRNIFQCFCQ